MATIPTVVISSTGISAPSYSEILEALKAKMQLIFGEDVYLEPDSMDGQLVAVFAQALHDCNQSVVAAYNSFSPATAVGVGLSNVVKINHMARLIPTKSQVNLTVTGVAGTTILNGIVGDDDGQRWLLPSSVVIPPAGFILVTALAENAGALNAPIGSATRILTPTAGWQTVDNATPATPGAPVESDAELRARQEITPAVNAYTVLTGLVAAIKALPGVDYGTVYENDTDTTDSNGLPEHSIAVVVKGGVIADIAQTIYDKKGPGVATHGTTDYDITDISGALRTISFFIPVEKAIKVELELTPGDDYTTEIASLIKAAVVNYINALNVGQDLVVNRLYSPALLGGSAEGLTYEISSLEAALLAGSLGTANIVIAFNEKATCSVSDVTIVVV